MLVLILVCIIETSKKNDFPDVDRVGLRVYFGRLPRRLYAAPYFLRPFPFSIAKLDTRYINRGPRKDVCEAVFLMLTSVCVLLSSFLMENSLYG